MLNLLAFGLWGKQELLRILGEDPNEPDQWLSNGAGKGGVLLVPPQRAVGQLPGDLWGNLYFLYDLPGWGCREQQGPGSLGNFLVAWHYGNLPTLLGEVFCP